MGLSGDITGRILRPLKTTLAVRDGRKVPEKRDPALLNCGGAVHLNATDSYAYLADSSGLA